MNTNYSLVILTEGITVGDMSQCKVLLGGDDDLALVGTGVSGVSSVSLSFLYVTAD